MDTDTGQSPAQSALKELHAYAKLLFLRSGRQFEDKTSYKGLEAEVPPDESMDGDESIKNMSLGNLDVDRLRREFLDRLSETISSAKGGRHVVASHMFYWPDKIKVFVAINSGGSKGDALSELDSLSTALNAISAASDDQAMKHTDKLWDILLRHQASRLKEVIVDLRQIMKSFQHLLPQNSSLELITDDMLPDVDGIVLDFEDCLKLLAKLLFGESVSVSERHDSLVNLSHTLYRTFPAEHFQALGRLGDKLHKAIGFLGRLKTSFHVLVAAARQISGFDDLSLIPVVGLKTRKRTLSHQWSLGNTCHALDIQLSDTAIGKLMEPSISKVRWTKNKLLNDFSRLKSPTWEVHAEIQLVLFILSHPEEVANALKTRGCHGKLYNHSWTVPLGDDLGNEEQRVLSETVMRVISWMRNELLASTKLPSQRRLEAKESTIGGSSIAIPGMSQENRQQIYVASEHLRRQRAQNSHTQRRTESSLDAIEHRDTTSIQSRHQTLEENASRLCDGCDVKTSRRCSHCGGAPFCGQACERRMRLEHLVKCNMRQVTSADYLYEDVLVDTIPEDPAARRDYWFDRCQHQSEETKLFGVFAGLLKYHPNHLTREELHQWRSDPGGNPYLVAKIVEKFEELPEKSRGGYFPWFLRHRTRFELPDDDRSIPRSPSPTTQIRNMQARARKYLAPEDQHKAVEDLTPFAKLHCFGIYSMVADHLHPSPVNREHCHWFDFGFVVCHDQREEQRLGSMYSTMILGSTSYEDIVREIGSSNVARWTNKISPTCSFDEFWRAWERGTLMTMFDKCWPYYLPRGDTFGNPEHDFLNRLRAFLEAETPRPSIWHLRHFLAMEDASVESAAPGIARAARDYGFSEQLNTRTTMELSTFYLQLMKNAEPLAVHRERMKGNLVHFAEGRVDVITPRVKKLLQGLS